MRYPGSSSTSAQTQTLITWLAVIFVVVAGILAFSKSRPPTAAITLMADQTVRPTLSPSPAELATIRFIDRETGQPIVQQPVTFTLYQCGGGTTCPTPTDLIITTDANGLLSTSPELLLQQPKLYSPGYQRDYYFVVPDPHSQQLVLTDPPADVKTTYLVRKETVVIALKPSH